MSFADPQSVTFPAPLAGTISLPRVSSGDKKSTYASADGAVTLSASSQNTGKNRVRRVLRLDHSKLTADVLVSGNSTWQSMSTYVVFDLPVLGYTNSEAFAVYGGLKGAMTANTDALITKLLGGES